MEIITPIDKIRKFMELKFPNRKLDNIDSGYQIEINNKDYPIILNIVYCDNQYLLTTDEFYIKFDSWSELERMFDELVNYTDYDQDISENEIEEWINSLFDFQLTKNNMGCIVRWNTLNDSYFSYYSDIKMVDYVNERTGNSINFANFDTFKRYYNYIK